MKSILLASLICLGLLTFLACKTQKKDSPTVNAVDNTERPLIEGKWHLVRSMDSYNKEWRDRTSSESYITMEAAGKYSEKDNSNPECKGTYKVVSKESLVINKECNNAELSYKLDELTDSKLLVSMTGRHGPVYSEYKRVSR